MSKIYNYSYVDDFVILTDTDAATYDMYNESYDIIYFLKERGTRDKESIFSYASLTPAIQDTCISQNLCIKINKYRDTQDPAKLDDLCFQDPAAKGTDVIFVRQVITESELKSLSITITSLSDDFLIYIPMVIYNLYATAQGKGLDRIFAVKTKQDFATTLVVQIPFSYKIALLYLSDKVKKLPLIVTDPNDQDQSIRNRSLRNIVRIYFSALWIYIPTSLRKSFQRLILRILGKNPSLNQLLITSADKDYDDSLSIMHYKAAFFFIAGYSKTPATADICDAWTSQRINALFSKMKIQTEKSFKGFLYDLSMINLFWDMYPEVRSEMMKFCLLEEDKNDTKWECLRS
jgi:hypothetical protein